MRTWDALLSRDRLGKPLSADIEVGRSPFHKDFDRIVFSGAFRRLGRKTQVHPVNVNEHVHTRLTHSLEVACVGRSLAMRVGEQLKNELPAWCHSSDLAVIVQSACLAHDIGNPPFGHSGEDAIRLWFADAEQQGRLAMLSQSEKSDFLNFDGNAQGFRVLTQLEYHQNEGGLRLTYATLGSYLKYPWTSQHSSTNEVNAHKFGAYQTELPILRQIAGHLGLSALNDYQTSWMRHPLVFLMEAADDICYALIDLEDGIEMNLLSFEEVEHLIQSMLGDNMPSDYHARLSTRRKLALLRGRAIDHLTQEAATAFVQHRQAILSGEFKGDLVSEMQDNARNCVHHAKKMAREKIFREQKKTLHEVGAYSILETLMSAFAGSVLDRAMGQGSLKSQRILDLMEEPYDTTSSNTHHALVRVLDFISSMTDAHAAIMARAISGKV